MHHGRFVVLAYVLASIGCTIGWTPADTSKTDLLAAKGLFNLAAYEAQGHKQANCSLANAAVRREWYGAPRRFLGCG